MQASGRSEKRWLCDGVRLHSEACLHSHEDADLGGLIRPSEQSPSWLRLPWSWHPEENVETDQDTANPWPARPRSGLKLYVKRCRPAHNSMALTVQSCRSDIAVLPG